jgi:hypothetical protein
VIRSGENTELTDEYAEQLLELIYIAVTEYDSATDVPLSEFVEDIAMSMDVTTNRADELRQMICQVLT